MLSSERVDSLIDWLREVAIFKDPVAHIYDYPIDPKDEPYINLAIKSGAVFLVSWDKHLKNLADLNHKEGQRFKERFPNILVMDPKQFLAHIRRKT